MTIRWFSFTLGLLVTMTVMSLAGVWQAGVSLGIILTSPVFGVLAADLDLAHPAVSHHRRRGMPAEVWNLDPGPGGGLDHVEFLTLGQCELIAVDEDHEHGSPGSIGRDS